MKEPEFIRVFDQVILAVSRGIKYEDLSKNDQIEFSKQAHQITENIFKLFGVTTKIPEDLQDDPLLIEELYKKI